MFKIFVGNLDYKVRAEQVRELFALYAPIEDLVLPTDPKTNKPRGFAIVMIRDPELGAAAVRGVQGKRLMGRELVVNEAIKKKGKAPRSPEPERKGPFGPRMFARGEQRSRGGSRNPRRAPSSGPSAAIAPSTPSSAQHLGSTTRGGVPNPPGTPAPAQAASPIARGGAGTPPKPEVSAAKGSSGHAGDPLVRMPVAKARPKTPPTP